MKTLRKVGRLQLHKQTLRALDSKELQNVNGASKNIFCQPSVLCSYQCPDTVIEPPSVSKVAGAVCPG